MAKRVPLEKRQQIAKEYETGASLRDLARKYNLAVSTVQRIADENEVMRNRGGIHKKYTTPKTFEDLEAAIFKLLPNATLKYDSQGQLVIYSGLKVVKIEALVPIEEEA